MIKMKVDAVSAKSSAEIEVDVNSEARGRAFTLTDVDRERIKHAYIYTHTPIVVKRELPHAMKMSALGQLQDFEYEGETLMWEAERDCRFKPTAH